MCLHHCSLRVIIYGNSRLGHGHSCWPRRPAHDDNWWVLCHAAGPMLLSTSQPGDNSSAGSAAAAAPQHAPRLRLGCRRAGGEAAGLLVQRLAQHRTQEGFLLQRAQYEEAPWEGLADACAGAATKIDHPVYFLTRWGWVFRFSLAAYLTTSICTSIELDIVPYIRNDVPILCTYILYVPILCTYIIYI